MEADGHVGHTSHLQVDAMPVETKALASRGRRLLISYRQQRWDFGSLNAAKARIE